MEAAVTTAAQASPSHPDERFDLVWVADKDDLPKAEHLVKTLPPQEQRDRGLRAPWFHSTPIPIPTVDGKYSGAKGHLISVNKQGILALPFGVVAVPNSNPVVKYCQCKQFVDFKEVDGLLCGNVKPEFWETKIAKKAIQKQEEYERDKAASLRAPRPADIKGHDATAAIVRDLFETVAWRTGSHLAAQMPDKVLANTYMMVKLTNQIPLPKIDEWLALFPAEQESTPEQASTWDREWTQWSFEEFMKMTRFVRASAISSKTITKDTRTGQVKDK